MKAVYDVPEMEIILLDTTDIVTGSTEEDYF